MLSQYLFLNKITDNLLRQNLDIPISHEKSSLVVPDLEGEYYISLFTYSKRGSTSYSFKINIK